MDNCVKIIAFAGPSGVGKSRLIHTLSRIDDRFTYTRPYTTRALRPGEIDKIHVCPRDIARLDRQGKLLAVTRIYGAVYGTPSDPLRAALQSKNVFAAIDWPITNIKVLKTAFPGQVHCVYVEPPSMDTLVRRLRADGRDPRGQRLDMAAVEIRDLNRGEFDGEIDHRIHHPDGMTHEVAEVVRDAYLRACGLK